MCCYSSKYFSVLILLDFLTLIVDQVVHSIHLKLPMFPSNIVTFPSQVILCVCCHNLSSGLQMCTEYLYAYLALDFLPLYLTQHV